MLSCGALILVFAFTSQGRALDGNPLDTRYIRTTFTVEDGLSSNVVSALLRTREGFLWVGNSRGSSRI